MFDNHEQDTDEDGSHETHDAPLGSPGLLNFLGCFQMNYCLLHIFVGLLDVVVNAVQDRPLLHHQYTQVLE